MSSLRLYSRSYLAQICSEFCTVSCSCMAEVDNPRSRKGISLIDLAHPHPITTFVLLMFYKTEFAAWLIARCVATLILNGSSQLVGQPLS